nr:MAG TPA: hypothetical protein [Caudoviricetes sp.]
MSALRDNKVLIHNVYKYIRNRGMAHIRIGGKSNSVPMVIRSKHNRTGTIFDVKGLSVALNLSHCVIKESGDIVSIGIDSQDRDACYLDLFGYGYTIKDFMFNRLFTVDVASNQQLYNEFTNFTSSYSFNVDNGITSLSKLQDYIGASIDTSTWKKVSHNRRISLVDVGKIADTIKGSGYYYDLSYTTDYLVERLEEFFFDNLISFKDNNGFNRKANFIDFIPIVSFDFSKSGKVKFYSSSGYIIDKTISDIEIKDLYSAIVTDKMFDSVKISKNEFNYEQFTLIIGK